jgi:hypothetical protein
VAVFDHDGLATRVEEAGPQVEIQLGAAPIELDSIEAEFDDSRSVALVALGLRLRRRRVPVLGAAMVLADTILPATKEAGRRDEEDERRSGSSTRFVGPWLTFMYQPAVKPSPCALLVIASMSGNRPALTIGKPASEW